MMRNDWPNTTAGALKPSSVSCRSASSIRPRSSTMFVADLVDRRVVGDQPADLGELRLRVRREPGVDDAQRDLDELEVAEVAVLRLGERLLAPGPA